MSTVRSILRRSGYRFLHQHHLCRSNVRYYRSNLLPKHTKIKMPEIGEDNQSGEIITWHKQIGDKLSVDDAVCEIDMEELKIDLEADEDGYLAEIVIPTGVKVKSGTTIARQVSTEEELVTFLDNLKNSRDTAERDLIFAYRIMADLGFDDYININHISVSIPSSPQTPWSKIMITSKAGYCWHNVTHKDLQEIDIDKVLKDKKITDTDIDIMDIYATLIAKIPTMNTIFHINTDNLLTFSCIKPNTLLQLNPLCARFLNRIVYVDDLDEIWSGNFITFANVIVIKNYGVIITGSSIEQAFDTFFYFQQMVKLQLDILKLQNGNSGLEIIEMDVEKTQELQKKYQENSYQIAKQHFDARKRSVLEKEEKLLNVIDTQE